MSAPNRFAEIFEEDKQVVESAVKRAERANLARLEVIARAFIETQKNVSALEYKEGEATQKELVTVMREFADRFREALSE
jgi:hypothetical protein